MVEKEYLFKEFMKRNCKEGITILEIGAGINEEELRKIGENLLIKDEFPACLVRVNPVMENAIVWEMLQRNLITRERYEEYLEGNDIDIEKELEAQESSISL